MRNKEELDAIISICREDKLPEDLIYDFEIEENKPIIKKNKRKNIRENKYSRKMKEKQKLKKLVSQNSYFYSEKESENGEIYYTRFYLSGCRKFAKRMTSKKNRKVTYLSNGAAYRRNFDYWYTLF